MGIVKRDRYHSPMFDTRYYIRGLPFCQLLNTKAASCVIYDLTLGVFRCLVPTGLDKGFLVLCRRLLSPFRPPYQPTKTDSQPRRVKRLQKMISTNPRDIGPLTTFFFAYKSEPLMACSRFCARMMRRGRRYGERLSIFAVFLSHAAGM